MISRLFLSKVISKYHLNGLVEKVIWKVRDNNLHIAFRSEAGNLTGELKIPCKVADGDYNIYDTSRLNKLLNILEGTILIDVTKNASNIPTMFSIADTKMDIQYNLAAPEILQGYWFDSSTLTEKLPEFDAVATLTEENLINFLKSVNALGSEVEDFEVSSRVDLNGPEILFTLGSKTSNRVNFGVSCEIKNPIETPIKYDIPTFKEMMNSNKNMESAQLHFSNVGIVKAEFKEVTHDGDEISVVYYIANKN